MTDARYTCYGPEFGRCGVAHRSLRTAQMHCRQRQPLILPFSRIAWKPSGRRPARLGPKVKGGGRTAKILPLSFAERAAMTLERWQAYGRNIIRRLPLKKRPSG